MFIKKILISLYIIIKMYHARLNGILISLYIIIKMSMYA